jgi:methylenetetrahydrofolate reductase (NADPH)
MSLSQIYHSEKIALSFELFPPKTEQGMGELMRTVQELARFGPDFFTCTYGAGGSTRDRTLEITRQIKSEFKIPVASHLTCVGSTLDQLRTYLGSAQRAKVDYIVALRGDPPKGQTEFQAVEGGLRYANDLVSLIRDEFPEFGIAVAGYPEVHQEALSPAADLDNLARKVASGADIVITQLFYDNADFFRFRDRCEARGINVPIVPGLLPVLSLNQVQRITSLCGAKLPQDFVQRLSKNESPEWQLEAGIEQASNQLRELLREGIPGIHFYVLNKYNATRRILDSVALDSAQA